MENAVGYVRVSSEEQSREGSSLDAQEARVRAYAVMRGLDLVTIYREEGVSAKTPLKNRPEGKRVVETLSKRRAQHVIAVKLDRLFRNTADALSQTEAWDKAKCAMHVIDMGGTAIDTSSAMGRMFFTMAAAFAEMERNLTSERTRSTLRHKKAAGEIYTRLVPFGFNRHGERLVSNAGELEVVRRMQTLRSAGQSYQQIADVMTRDGVPTKRGGRWHPVTVQKVLKVHGPDPL